MNGGDNLTSLDNLLNGGWGGGDFTQGPITGENYGQWIDRLRTVENLVEDPNLRQQLATARNRIEDYRREWQRRGEPPRWGDVQSSVMAPLSEVRLQLARDLARREQPESLLPADRDPVPDRYSDSVRSYYENLSSQ